ncbi:MAG TPA: cysteine desulfurase NifS [Nitrospirae bacterium]|nr:cysteine desulfurase NifS [Nitrospirota bacterium]HDZ02916.1 cysteine desulfurase NifS [Nitrospirota bacterium]
MKVIYLDNNATTRVADEVREVILPYFSDLYGNPSSMHTFGGQVHRKIETAREQIAALINAEPEEIIFTSCGTESDNTAIMSALVSRPEKRHIITTRVEHPAVLNFCKTMARRGYRVTFLPVDKQGRLSLEELKEAITDETAVVSIMYANNESGVIFPISEIAGIVKSKGALFHTDAVQAAGKIPVDVKKLYCDMMSISGHKMHAPKGVGALYVKRDARFSPYMIGGHQEKGRRAGTENVASIIGFGKAGDLAKEHLPVENTKVKELRDRLEQGLLRTCPDTRVNGDRENRLPNTTNISFEYVEGEAILLRLNEYNICASSGSACTSGSLEPSHVLRSMGVPFTAIHGSVRFSLSRYTTDKDIDFVLEKMPPIINELRELSPYGRELKDAR